MSTEKKSMMDKILEKVDVIAGPMTKFGQIPFVRGIVNGMVAALPVTMVGSLFLVVLLNPLISAYSAPNAIIM